MQREHRIAPVLVIEHFLLLQSRQPQFKEDNLSMSSGTCIIILEVSSDSPGVPLLSRTPRLALMLTFRNTLANNTEDAMKIALSVPVHLPLPHF